MRWDCPAEYVQYHTAVLQQQPQPTPAAAPTRLVSGYDTESDNDEEAEEEEKEDEEDHEHQPDFIGPRVPKVCGTSHQLFLSLSWEDFYCGAIMSVRELRPF